MMKIVPDPPPFRPATILQTAQSPFSSCNNAHESLFHVRSGVIAEDALIHISRHLQTACETSTRIVGAKLARDDVSTGNRDLAEVDANIGSNC
ncbi:hypothetical protein [Pseudomonas sp. R5(2019)]|uniref:hypothetical protein n=1 Tax=Pseudomonas sp. R5(2019) TaxID=2697566 RepID=UPI001411E5A3|nr:hypothetical protein [Pseudomonas sp. R5(2019)]NBA97996.1 hypothetical protein [Pseudomonas sp. R5(2019)]